MFVCFGFVSACGLLSRCHISIRFHHLPYFLDRFLFFFPTNTQEIPYAAKLLLQELLSMCIQTRIYTKNFKTRDNSY